MFRALVLACLGLGLVAPRLVMAERVEKKSRVLVIVLDLQTHGVAEYRWLYDWIEAFVVAQVPRLVGPAYQEIRLLGGEKATVEELEKQLNEIEADASIVAADAIIQLHGIPGELVFREGASTTKKLAERFSGKTKKLRALHSGACYGSSHAADWLAAGFRVVAGARKVNTNGMYDLPTFLTEWSSGKSFDAAQSKANNPAWIKFFDAWAIKLGFQDVDSFKEIHGNKDLDIGVPVAALEKVNYASLFKRWNAEKGKMLGFSLDRVNELGPKKGPVVLTKDTYKRGFDERDQVKDPF